MQKYKAIYEIPLAGVYVLWKDGQAIYVGATTQLLRRLTQHRYSKDWDSFSFIQVQDAEERAKLEVKLIRELNPVFNKTSRSFPVNTKHGYKNAKRRFEAEKALLKKHGGIISSRKMCELLLKEYNIRVCHSTVNTDLRILRKNYTL